MKMLLSLTSFLLVFNVGAQSIQWTSFEHLDDSLRNRKKSILVFIKTDWCKYCKMQENITFKNSRLLGLLSQNYYCLYLNAEDKSDITMLSRVYSYQSGSGYHKLAEMLGKQNGELILPSTILLNGDLQVTHRLRGFQNSEDLLTLIQ